MKNNNKIGQEPHELTPVKTVGCEDDETGSRDPLTEWAICAVVYMANHPEEWVGPFNTVKEAQAWLEADDEVD